MIFELVLPCYNESKSIEVILNRAIAAAKEYQLSPETFQLVLVENGSTDNSRDIMKQYESHPDYRQWFRVVPIDMNQGYGFGIWKGLQTTDAPFVAWSHADQQCDPRDTFKALQLLQSESTDKTLIKGVRHGRSLKERFVSRVFEIVARFLLRFSIYEINAQPKVFPRELLNHCTNPPRDFSFDLYVLYVAHRNGYQFKTIDVSFPPRIHGFSNWAFSLKNRYKTIINMIRYMYRLRKEKV